MSSLLVDTDLNQFQTEAVTMISTSSDLLVTVVDDVLDYSKLESGDFNLNIEKTDLQLTIGTVLTSIQMKAIKSGRGIIIRPYIGIHVPRYIETDSKRMQQIIYNLLGNAIKFSPDNSFVDVHVDLVDSLTTVCNKSTNHYIFKGDDCRLQITIKDYGIGIQEKNFEKIFLPFQQESAQVSTVYGGTGLGLPITRKLAKKLGGTVSVDSSLGHWTNFIVDLPFTGQKASIDDYLSGLKVKIVVLLVNTVPQDACPLIKWLMSAGIQVHHHWSCQELEVTASRIEKENPNVDRVYITFIRDLDYNDHAYVEFAKNHLSALISFGQDNTIDRAAAYMSNPWLVFPSVMLRIMSTFAQRLHTASSSPIAHFEDCSMVVFNTEVITKVDANLKLSNPLGSSRLTPYRDLGLRILVAEDNKVNQKVLKRTLNRLGLNDIEIVDNGRLAVEAIQRSPCGYDLILMDMEMPVLGGVEASREITAMKKGITPLIIFVTAHAMESFRIEAHEAGGSGFISKPFNLDMIDKTLRSFHWEKLLKKRSGGKRMSNEIYLDD